MTKLEGVLSRRWRGPACGSSTVAGASAWNRSSGVRRVEKSDSRIEGCDLIGEGFGRLPTYLGGRE